MTGAFVVMFGIVSIARGETRCTFRDATLHDTTHAAVLALSAISVSWGLSAAQFLKIEEPGIGGVRLKRRNALQSLSTLIGGRLTIAAMDALIDTINDLSSDAQAAITSLPEEADRQLARTWAQAAASLHELLEGLSPNDFRDIRAKLVSDVRDNMRELARTC